MPLSDECGDPIVLCGDAVCCVFDSTAYALDGMFGASVDPCDSKYWSPPAIHPETGLRTCEYEDLAIDSQALYEDLVSGAADPSGIWDEEYWGEAVTPPPVFVPADPDCTYYYGACDPPPIWTRDATVTATEHEAAWANMTFRFSSKLTMSERDSFTHGIALLTESVAMLQSSLDLVGYACCLVLGPDNADCECLLDYLTGRMSVVFRPQSMARTDASKANSNGPHSTRVYFYPAWIARDVADFTSGDANQRTAAVIRTAGTLVEEYLHKCFKEKGYQDDHKAPCDPVDAVNDAVSNLLTQRYVI